MVELLLECVNRDVVPVVPSRGSVGASGDLAPLAHLALPLVGEGRAVVDGEELSGADALARAGLEPIRLHAKEGLSLINGTQFMAAVGALALVRARRLAKTADIACALSVEALQASRVSFLPEVHALRPLPGQVAAAANVLQLLEGSAVIEAHRWCDKVQDAYSLRCAPQVHGASRDILEYAERTIAIELNAATDNPLVIAEQDELMSNGNFHGQPLAFALDALAMALAEFASISERRIERLVNPVALRRSARVPHARRRAELGLHDPAVRGGGARQREQGSVPSRERRLDPDERGPGGSRVDGERLRAQVLDRRCERRAHARDRVARRGAGRRVSRSARAGRRWPRGARLRPHAVADRVRGSPALRRTSNGWRPRSARASSSPRSSAKRGARVSVRSVDALVEELCGDLRSIRAPRGTQLNARSWQTEAPLRMLLNNLDPEVAERPEELVVYGGTGKAARNHDALKALVRSLLTLGEDETLLVQSGKPVGVFTTHAGAPRVLIANALLVPRWATWEEFRRLEDLGLTMFGQMTAGSWIYIGTQGILQGTYQTFAAAGETHFGSPDLRGRTILTAGLGGMGGAQPLAATMAGAAISVHRGRSGPDQAAHRDALPRRDGGLVGRRVGARALGGGGPASAVGGVARERRRRRAGARTPR